MATTSITLTDPVSGISVPIWPAAGVSAKSLEVEPIVRGVTESRVGAHGSVDTTLFMDAAAVTLSLILYSTGQSAFLNSLGPLMQPSARPNLIVTDDEWTDPRQLTVRLDSMQKPRSDRTNWPVQIIWLAVNGVWEDASQTVLDVPVTLPSTTGIAFKAQGAGLSFTATNATPCVFTATAHGYTAAEQVTITGSVPAGFTSGQEYYVTAPAANTFELAASPEGSALASTSTGSGTVFAGGGVHVSATIGLDMPPTSAPGETQATSPGTVASQWQAFLYGPCTGPKLANDATGLTLEFTDDLSLNPGEYVFLDSASHSALLNSDPGSPVLANLNFGTSDWWLIQPGVNQLRYYPSSGSAGAEAVITYRPAWLT